MDFSKQEKDDMLVAYFCGLVDTMFRIKNSKEVDFVKYKETMAKFNTYSTEYYQLSRQDKARIDNYVKSLQNLPVGKVDFF